MDNFIIIISFLLIGMLLRRVRVFTGDTGNILSLFVIYVSLPSLVLLKIPELELSGRLLVPALMPWVMLLISALAIVLLSRVFHWNRETTGCLLLLIPLGNTSFLGIPMVKAFFGDGAIPYALLYDQLGSFLALATYGSLVLALYGSGEKHPTTGSVLRKVFTFPPFLALILAFFLKTVNYPPVVSNLLGVLAATLIPLVMIAVGFQLQMRLSREVTAQLGMGLTIKLIAAPLVALVICRIAGLDGEAVRVSIFEAGMPPMVSAGAVAIMAGLSPSLTAALVGIGIALSFLTLPILHQLLI